MRTRRNQLAAALLAIVGAGMLVIAATGAATKATVSAASNATLGKIIVGANGLTLYDYTVDHGKVVKCVGACAAQWPPVLIAKNAEARRGARDHGFEARHGEAAGRHDAGHLRGLRALSLCRRHEEGPGQRPGAREEVVRDRPERCAREGRAGCSDRGNLQSQLELHLELQFELQHR